MFWFPFNKDLCYGYWDSVANSIPIRFFGISSLGPTILNYHDYKPHHLPDGTYIWYYEGGQASGQTKSNDLNCIY